MLRTAPLLLLAWVSPARAATNAECIRSVETALREHRAAPFLDCLAPDARWQDAAGYFAKREDVAARVKTWVEVVRPKLPEKGFEVVAVDSATYLIGASDDVSMMPQRFILALENAPPWTHGRLYATAARWPAVEGVVRSSSHTAALDDFDAVMTSFNTEFSAGNVDAWVARWQPDAVFYSGVGEVRGPQIRSFFEHQAKRYVGPNMSFRWKFDGPFAGAVLAEGVLRGRCRENKKPFEMPIVLYTRYKDHKIAAVAEAFRVVDDGCGPFLWP